MKSILPLICGFVCGIIVSILITRSIDVYPTTTLVTTDSDVSISKIDDLNNTLEDSGYPYFVAPTDNGIRVLIIDTSLNTEQIGRRVLHELRNN